MSRTQPKDTADRTGQVLPTATHCAISYLSLLFQGTGQLTWTEIVFPHVLHTVWTTALSKNLTVNTHMLEHFPYSHTRIICQDPRHRTPMSLCPLSQRSPEMQCSERPEPSQAPLPGIVALADWSWIPVAQG